ncbi:MAG: glycosyltransferase [Paludibacter sp.]
MVVIIGIILIVVYLILIITYVSGWKRTAFYKVNKAVNDTISVVIACKNEADNLSALFHSLMNQSYTNYEIIFVNDNSTDNTLNVLSEFSKKHPHCKVLNSTEHGKKAALKLGIENASNEKIITTDADCLHPTRWLETMSSFQQSENYSLVIGPVEFEHTNTFFNQVQIAEFQTLISSGAAMAAYNKAIMCNGANLMFLKSDWLSNYKYLHSNIKSGDDVFLLHRYKKSGKKIGFLKSVDAMVKTRSCNNLSEFFNQRKRWTSKSTYYTDFDTIATALIVLTIQIYLMVLSIMSFVTVSYLYFLLIIFLLKFIADLYFIKNTSEIYSHKTTAKTAFALAVIYPIYIIIIAFSGLFRGFNDKYRGNYQ